MSTLSHPGMVGSPIEGGFATVPEAARFLRISRAKLYEMMEDRELIYAKIGRCRRLPWKSLREFAEKSLVGNVG